MRPKNGSAWTEARKEMEEAFGFVPQFYSAVPEAARASTWGVHRDLEFAETALDNKVKELIGLAVASHIKCRYCIYFHTENARALGATEEEMHEAVAMGGTTVLFSNMITGAQVDYEQFKGEVNRAISHVMKQQGPPSQAKRPRA